MAWKFEAGRPLCSQIVDRIRQDVLSGVYGRGEPFPTTRQLAGEAGVNPNTMQKALTLLEDEGLLVTLGTAGRTVTSDEGVISAARDIAAAAIVQRAMTEARPLGIGCEELCEMIRRNWNDEQ